MYGYIYKTTNLINGHTYIGKHKSPRFDATYYGSGKLLHAAIRRYGIENFAIEVLQWCETLQQLNVAEQMRIILAKLHGGANYNIAGGGSGGNAIAYMSDDAKLQRSRRISKHLSATLQARTPEQLAKVSEQQSLSWQNPDTRQKRSAGIKAAKSTKAASERQSEINRKRWSAMSDDERQAFRDKMAKVNAIRTQRADVKEKLSKGQRRRYERPEEHSKLSNAVRTAMQNPEIKERIANAVRQALSNTEVRAKISMSQKQRFQNTELRRQVSERQRKRYAENPMAVEINRAAQMRPEVREKRSKSLRLVFGFRKLYGTVHVFRYEQAIGKFEPWMSFIIQSDDNVIVFAWDTRKVLFQCRKSDLPDGYVPAKDSHLELQF